MPKQPTAELVLTEAEMQRHIVKQARELGYSVYFTWKSYHSPAGFPDLTLARIANHMPATGLFVECKSEKGKLTDVQREWLATLAVGFHCETYVVRPSTLESFYRVLLGQAVEMDKEALKP